METETILLMFAGVAFIGGSLALGFWIRGREGELAKWFRSWIPKRFVVGDIDVNVSVRTRGADAQSHESRAST